MHHLDLLGAPLKDDFLCELFETYEVQVEYLYDRTHEDLPDEYHAEIVDLGLQFVFDDRQALRTLFLTPVDISTFNPFEDDERVPMFVSKAEALNYASANGSNFTEGEADFLGEQKDWIRFESDAYTIHYEFVDGGLRKTTLQSVADCV
ncbi:MAG: hypothetical protein AAGF31_07525 [Planctomycetota bacterium]